MPFATSARDLQIVDPVLTNLARRYKPEGYIYSDLLPTIPVQKDSGKYPTFDEAYWFAQLTQSKVSDRAETPEVNFTWSTDTYLCEDFRLKVSITRKERRQAHEALGLERNKLDFLLTQMANIREQRAQTLFRATGNGGDLTGGSATPSNKWNVDAATIEVDVKTGKIAVYNKTGKTPNTIVLPYAVSAEVAIQQDIREILKYTVNGQQILDQGEFILPARLWGMKTVIPQGVLVNSAREGATKSLADLWSDNVLLLYIAGNGPTTNGAGWGIPSTGYSFKALPEEVDRWEERDPPVEYVRAWECVDEKVCGADLGYEIYDVL